MNHIDTNTSLAARIPNRAPETIIRSPGVPAFAPLGTDDLNVSGKFDTQRQGVRTALADVQSAVSTVQESSAQLGGVSQQLSNLGELAQQAADVADGSPQLQSLQQQFQDLQNQLAQNATGEAAAGVAPVVEKDSSGTYALKVDSTDANDTISAALQATKQSDGSLNTRLDRLQRAGVMLQVEYSNLQSAVPGLQDANDAASALASVKASFFARPDSTLATQGGQTPQSVLKLLES